MVKILLRLILHWCQRTCFRTVCVPYLNLTLKPSFSITTRQKLKAKLYSDRKMLTLQEYILMFNLCGVVFENFDLKVWLTCGTVRIRKKIR